MSDSGSHLFLIGWRKNKTNLPPNQKTWYTQIESGEINDMKQNCNSVWLLGLYVGWFKCLSQLNSKQHKYFYQQQWSTVSMFQSTYDFKNAFTQLGHSCQKVHHSRKDLILHFLELRGGAATASLALERTLTVPLPTRQLPLPCYCSCERKERGKKVSCILESAAVLYLVKMKTGTHTHTDKDEYDVCNTDMKIFAISF